MAPATDSGDCNLIYGLGANGTLTSVSVVPNGLACGCTCPGCGEALISVQGPVRAWHFRHEAESACATGFETMAHLLAKKIIMESAGIKLPSLIARYYDLQAVVLRDTIVPISGARSEEWQDGIRPDVIVCADGVDIAVEIFVTHRVEEKKAEVFAARKQPSIEIDMSDFRYGMDERKFRAAVVIQAPRSWLFNVALAPAMSQLKAQYQEREAALREAEIKRTEEARRQAIAITEHTIKWNTGGREEGPQNSTHGLGGEEELRLKMPEVMFLQLDRLYASSYRHFKDPKIAALWVQSPQPSIGNQVPRSLCLGAPGFDAWINKVLANV